MKDFIPKCASGFVKIYKYGVVSLFYMLLVFIGILCTVGTCAVDEQEIIFFTADSIFLNIGVVIIFILCGIFISSLPVIVRFCERVEKDESFFLKCRRILLFIIFILCAIWVISTEFGPLADQSAIQNTVHAVRNLNFAEFAEGGYFSRFHHQLGLLGIYYLIALVFGTHNYVILQLINGLAIILFYRELSELCKKFGFRRIVQLGVVLMGGIFFPLIMYCAFIYGNLMGLAFAVFAIRKEFDYFEKDKISDAVVSAIAIFMAILCKSNYLIFLIGMLGHAVIEVLRSSKYKHSILIVMLAVAVLVQSTVPSLIAEKVSGYKFDQGTSSLAYIAMGLQDSYRGPGWYNGYVLKSYDENNYNTEKQAEVAKEEIINRVKYFMSDKSEACNFFLKKLASQWAEPTFQSFWIVQSLKSSFKQSELMYNLVSEEGEVKSAQFLNLLQIVCIFGGILFCILYRKKMDSSYLILPLIFIGGFVFHIFWEAKGQYTLSYFVLLFPYVIAGYNELFTKVGEWLKKDVLVEKKKDVFLQVLLAISSIMICGFAGLSSLGYTACLTEDTTEYIEYVEYVNNLNEKIIENGTYYLYTDSGKALSEVNVEEGIDYVVVSNAPTKINISNYQGLVMFCFKESYQFLTVEETGDLSNRPIISNIYIDTYKQRLSVDSVDENSIYIKFGDEYALTFDEESGSVFISNFTGAKNQVWYVEHAE